MNSKHINPLEKLFPGVESARRAEEQKRKNKHGGGEEHYIFGEYRKETQHSKLGEGWKR